MPGDQRARQLVGAENSRTIPPDTAQSVSRYYVLYVFIVNEHCYNPWVVSEYFIVCTQFTGPRTSADDEKQMFCRRRARAQIETKCVFRHRDERAERISQVCKIVTNPRLFFHFFFFLHNTDNKLIDRQ